MDRWEQPTVESPSFVIIDTSDHVTAACGVCSSVDYDDFASKINRKIYITQDFDFNKYNMHYDSIGA